MQSLGTGLGWLAAGSCSLNIMYTNGVNTFFRHRIYHRCGIYLQCSVTDLTSAHFMYTLPDETCAVSAAVAPVQPYTAGTVGGGGEQYPLIYVGHLIRDRYTILSGRLLHIYTCIRFIHNHTYIGTLYAALTCFSELANRVKSIYNIQYRARRIKSP